MSNRIFALWLVAATLGFWLLTRAPGPEAPRPLAPLRRPPAKVADVVELEVFASGLDQPVFLCAAPGDASGRLLVVQKTGKILVLRDGKPAGKPFLDLTEAVSRSVHNMNSEQGLLGLAFHPKYAENGRAFVNYTDRKGDTRVVEYRRAAGDADRLDPESARELLRVDQPFPNHNGGHLVFGPDGKLYIGLGDGGGAGDPLDAGQDPKNLLGKMLRMDVDVEKPAPEIWQLGLRNPWRYCFDRKTGDLYIADVGQNKWEEVNVVSGRSKGGENFGWDIVEGIGHCFKARNCDQRGLVQPVAEYGHDLGCSITGGYVYRGKAIPEIDGVYFYGDFCTALVRSFRWTGGKATDEWEWRPVLDPQSQLATISSFGEDAEGELYVLSLDGKIWKLVRAAR